MAHGSQEDDWQQGGFGCGQGSLNPKSTKAEKSAAASALSQKQGKKH